MSKYDRIKFEQRFSQKLHNSEYTERWYKVNRKKILKDIPWDLVELLNSKDNELDSCIRNWYKNYDNDIMRRYIQDKGDTLKLHINEIFRLWQFVENLVEWKPENIWVSDTWFLYEIHWWNEYWNIEEDESYKQIYSEWIKIFQDNKDSLQELLPEKTVLVDVWCCEWDKAKALLEGAWKKIRYLPVDVDEEYLRKAKWKIEALWIEIMDWVINTWKITDSIWAINDDETNNYTYFFTWWSIWNYSDDVIHQMLSKTFKPKHGSIVLDYYKAPENIFEIRDILKSYDNEPTKNWFKNWLNNLGFYPWYYFPGKDDMKEFSEELDWQYKIPEQWFWYSLVNIDDFLEYTVRYELQDGAWNNYYLTLDKDHNLILQRNGWEETYWIVFNSEWNRYNAYRLCWGERKQLKYKNELPKFNWFQWKIVEWFTAKESANRIKFVEDYVGKIKWSPEWIERSESNEWEIMDNFKWWELLKNRFDTLKGDDVYLQEMVCQIWFKWRDDEFIPANFKEWEFYPIEISRRFSDAEMIKFLKDAGLEVDERNIFNTCNDENWQKCNSKYLNVIVATTPKK